MGIVQVLLLGLLGIVVGLTPLGFYIWFRSHDVKRVVTVVSTTAVISGLAVSGSLLMAAGMP